MKYEVKLEFEVNQMMFFEALVRGAMDYLKTLPNMEQVVEKETAHYVLEQILKAKGEKNRE